MPKRTSRASIGAALRLIEMQSLRSAIDQELLRRFVDSNDGSAFRVIAERHGPMVLGVCRRALRCPHDAEDAFQATFLVFSRRAPSIRKTASLGSWMHGVASRVAMKLRREQSRRQRREQIVRQTERETPAEELTWAEVKTGMDEELQRLPDQYRSVLVLCYLEGQTRDEAALQLGLTLSALHGRLERGRRLLAGRLTRRGLTLSAAFLPVALCPSTMLATVRAGTLFAEQHSIATLVAPSVLSLTHETLKGISMGKFKLAVASVICAAMLIVGIGFGTAQTPNYEGAKSANPLSASAADPISPAKTAGSDNLKNTLLALDKHMWEAGAKGDWQERQKFLADDLVSISVLGKYGKADAAASDKQSRLSDWTIRDPEVVRVSADVAMLSYRYDCKINSPDGKVLETRKDNRVVYTWAYRSGGWVIVFAHDDHGRQGKDFDSMARMFGKGQFDPLPPRTDPNVVASNKAPATGPSAIDLDLLKTKLQLAKLAFMEKQLLLDAAIAKKADPLDIELRKVDRERAQLLVKEAELNLQLESNKAQPSPKSSSRP